MKGQILDRASALSNPWPEENGKPACSLRIRARPERERRSGLSIILSASGALSTSAHLPDSCRNCCTTKVVGLVPEPDPRPPNCSGDGLPRSNVTEVSLLQPGRCRGNTWT